MTTLKKLPPIAVIFAVVVGLFAASVEAKSDGSGLWLRRSENRIASRGNRLIIPEQYLVYGLNRERLKTIFDDAPLEFTENAQSRITIIELPTPDGTIERFRILESPVLAPNISAEFPDWKTFQAYGIDDPTATARLGITANGFHASVFSTRGTYQIDPYQKNDLDNYITYYKKYITAERNFHCLLDKKLFNEDYPEPHSFMIAPQFSHGSQIRTYRLAIAVTGEYTAVFGSQANALAQVVITTNRMNGIYRKDFAVGLQLVSGTNLIYTDPATDPYTNVINSAQLDVNQNNINTVIGTANYDVGHLFATSNNGLAALSSICTTSKARGASGQPNPQGDGFDVDYVAHEIGHQIGANHTFNADGNCGSGSSAARKEPGSAVTIMGYAGICSSTSNLQRNSIDNFLGHSQQEAITFLGGTGGTCGTLSGSNAIPTVTVGSATYNIPFNTPFALTANASDGNNDPLTYAWEWNTASGGSTSTYPGTPDDDDINLGTSRPLMRPYSPSTSPTRLFPSLPYILNNANEPPVTYTGTSATGSVCAATCATGEDLPSVARTVNFRVTVRDNNGGVADATTDVSFINTTTPFTISSQNSAVTYAGNSTQTVTWNVSGTTAAPISTANVKISFSSDGGQTFPTTILASTPNDGTETITVPNIGTTQGRIKVEAVGNIFFDINNANITVNAVAAGIRAPFDYDGDDKTDISIYRPGAGQWWYQRSSNGTVFAAPFGNATDKIVPADYTGDQKADLALFRPSTGEWYVLRSEDSSFFAFPFGTSTDTPVPGDYDGDNKADAAVFRSSTNTWFIQKSTGGTDIIGFGAAGDKPVPADYDGDNKTDIAIFRPAVGQWWVRRSSNGSVFALTFGISTDKPVQGFYTADNKADIAIWRPSTGEWFILRSEDNSFFSTVFGVSTDVPVAGDYDGDDRYDIGVFRPSTNTWFIQRTTAGILIQAFGTTGDLPTPNAFVP